MNTVSLSGALRSVLGWREKRWSAPRYCGEGPTFDLRGVRKSEPQHVMSSGVPVEYMSVQAQILSGT
jgi:hypothetical protein